MFYQDNRSDIFTSNKEGLEILGEILEKCLVKFWILIDAWVFERKVEKCFYFFHTTFLKLIKINHPNKISRCRLCYSTSHFWKFRWVNYFFLPFIVSGFYFSLSNIRKATFFPLTESHSVQSCFPNAIVYRCLHAKYNGIILSHPPNAWSCLEWLLKIYFITCT